MDLNGMRFPRNPTEQDYYERFVDVMSEQDDHFMDVVAGRDEWALARAAIMRWVAEQDVEHDALRMLPRSEGGEAPDLSIVRDGGDR